MPPPRLPCHRLLQYFSRDLPRADPSKAATKGSPQPPQWKTRAIASGSDAEKDASTRATLPVPPDFLAQAEPTTGHLHPPPPRLRAEPTHVARSRAETAEHPPPERLGASHASLAPPTPWVAVPRLQHLKVAENSAPPQTKGWPPHGGIGPTAWAVLSSG